MDKAEQKRLRKILIDRGMTARELSKAVGMTTTTYYRKLRGLKYDFSRKELREILDTLELTPEEFMMVFFAPDEEPAERE